MSASAALNRAASEPELDIGRKLESVLISVLSGLALPANCETTHPLAQKWRGRPFTYNDELAQAVRPDQAYLHRRLKDMPLPALTPLPQANGLDLTHHVFYATDFGRAKITNASVRTRLLSALGTETNLDLMGEYLMALRCVNHMPAQNLRSAFWTQWNANLGIHTVMIGGLLNALGA